MAKGLNKKLPFEQVDAKEGHAIEIDGKKISVVEDDLNTGADLDLDGVNQNGNETSIGMKGTDTFDNSDKKDFIQRNDLNKVKYDEMESILIPKYGSSIAEQNEWINE